MSARKCCRHPANLHGDTVNPPGYGDPCNAVNGFRLEGDDTPLEPCPCPGWLPNE